ncbi:MAG: DUF2019 domain-containing protein [Chloroflexi bacterium]|nr:DUF2019 domain-containing protein [Chloroflexota bacterium]
MKTSLDELLNTFAEAAAGHHEALLQGNWRKANPLAKKVDRAFRRIIEFDDDGRKALLEMTSHPNLAVAGIAAVYSLKYDTRRALAVLRRISQEPGLIGFGAKQAIQRWEEGSWQLE